MDKDKNKKIIEQIKNSKDFKFLSSVDDHKIIPVITPAKNSDSVNSEFDVKSKNVDDDSWKKLGVDNYEGVVNVVDKDFLKKLGLNNYEKIFVMLPENKLNDFASSVNTGKYTDSKNNKEKSNSDLIDNKNVNFNKINKNSKDEK